MKRKLIGLALTLAVVYLTSCTPTAEEAWKLAEEKNTVEGYDAFIREYPENEELVAIAKNRKASVAFENATLANTASAYSQFITNYPKNKDLVRRAANKRIMLILPEWEGVFLVGQDEATELARRKTERITRKYKVKSDGYWKGLDVFMHLKVIPNAEYTNVDQSLFNEHGFVIRASNFSGVSLRIQPENSEYENSTLGQLQRFTKNKNAKSAQTAGKSIVSKILIERNESIISYYTTLKTESGIFFKGRTQNGWGYRQTETISLKKIRIEDDVYQFIPFTPLERGKYLIDYEVNNESPKGEFNPVNLVSDTLLENKES